MVLSQAFNQKKITPEEMLGLISRKDKTEQRMLLSHINRIEKKKSSYKRKRIGIINSSISGFSPDQNTTEFTNSWINSQPSAEMGVEGKKITIGRTADAKP